MAVGTGVGKCLHTLPSHPVVGKPHGLCRGTLACKLYPSKYRLFADVQMPQRRRLVSNRGKNCTTSAGSSVRESHTPFFYSFLTLCLDCYSAPSPPPPPPPHTHLPPCKYQKYIGSAIVISYELIWSIPDTFSAPSAERNRLHTTQTEQKQLAYNIPWDYYFYSFYSINMYGRMRTQLRSLHRLTIFRYRCLSLTLGHDSYFKHSQ